ncbi:MAG: hypothetical protein ACI93R_003792, partial [Flavobacteriales bacterium]
TRGEFQNTAQNQRFTPYLSGLTGDILIIYASGGYT